MIKYGVIVVAVLLLSGCSGKQGGAESEDEDREAKTQMQGV